MSSLMFQAADAIMKVATNAPVLAESQEGKQAEDWAVDFYHVVHDTVMPIILVVLGAIAVIFGILRGVRLARAESADQQQEAKRSLITFIIGIGVAIGLVLLLFFLLPTIISWFNSDLAKKL